jgi:hypothetical protein
MNRPCRQAKAAIIRIKPTSMSTDCSWANHPPDKFADHGGSRKQCPIGMTKSNCRGTTLLLLDAERH